MLIVTLLTVDGCATEASITPATSVVTSTTKIAGAGVLGNQRRPDESCAPEPVPADPGPSVRSAADAAGVAEQTADVPAEAHRIVVLAGDQLDALCALGLQSRIVGAALPGGAAGQPSYLGAVIHDLPAVGTRAAPDLAAIAALKPDLILGSQGSTPTVYAALADIAPTVFTAAPGPAWQDNLRGVGAATARGSAADDLLERFAEEAAETGRTHDAAHFQASVVTLTDKTLRVYGSVNFAATVLRAAGLDRPPAQRFTDRPYLEIGTDDLAGADFSPADGDIIYVSFDSPAAKQRAGAVLDSNAWRRLSANRDNRVFVVNNEVWHTGQGLVAARGIIEDLRWVNAPIN